jgi:hypothetical protein
VAVVHAKRLFEQRLHGRNAVDVAGELLARGLADTEAYALLEHWNAHRYPPTPERLLRAAFEAARDLERRAT